MVCPVCWAVLAISLLPRNVVPGSQIESVFVTFIVAWTIGLAAEHCGVFIRLYKSDSYNDAVEFIVEAEHH